MKTHAMVEAGTGIENDGDSAPSRRTRAALAGIALTGVLLAAGLAAPAAGAQDVAGNALRLNGTTAKAEAHGIPLGDNQSFTVEAWVRCRVAAEPGNISPAVAKLTRTTYHHATQSGEWLLGLRPDGVPIFNLHAANATLDAYPLRIPAGHWVHLAAVYDASIPEARLYVDGGYMTVSPRLNAFGQPWREIVRPQGANTAPVTLGFSPGSHLDGNVDEVRIWNVARTPTQISGTMNTPLTGTEPGLIAYWRMDDGAGTVATDSSGHGRVAHLLGGATWEVSSAGLSTEPVTMTVPPRGGRQAKAQATIRVDPPSILQPVGRIEESDLKDQGAGYDLKDPDRPLAVMARGHSGTRAVGSYYPGWGWLSIFDPTGGFTDETTLVIPPPHMGDLSPGVDNPRCNEIRLGVGTYYDNVIVDRDLTIRGAGMGRTLVSGALLGTVFTVLPGRTLHLEDLTVFDGLAPSGGGIYNQGTVVLERVEVRDCRAFDYWGGEGGGIYNRGSARLTVRNSVIRNNGAARNGGGISSSGLNVSTLRVGGGRSASEELTGHRTDLGEITPPLDPTNEDQAEAVEAEYVAKSSTRAGQAGSAEAFMGAQLGNSDSEGGNPLTNIAGWLGLGSPVTEVIDSIIEGNRAGTGVAAARYLTKVCWVNGAVLSCYVADHIPTPRALAVGGGIHTDLGLLRIRNSVLTGNEAAGLLGSHGGAVSSFFSGLEVTDSKVNGNRVRASTILAMGAAIHSFGSYTRVSDSELNDNAAEALFLSSGGAMKTTFGSFVRVQGSELNRNTSGGGGAIANDYYSVLLVEDSTLADNRVSGVIAAYGGGLRNENGGQAILMGSTISGNVAKGKSKGGGVYNDCAGSSTIIISTVTLQNCTVSGNTVDGEGTWGIPLPAFGAGLYNGSFTQGTAVATLVDCTIFGNEAVNGLTRQGGGIYSTAMSSLKARLKPEVLGVSVVNLSGTLLAENVPNDVFNRTQTLQAFMVSTGHNLDTDGTGAEATWASELLLPEGARFRTVDDPGLGPLEFNGGGTRTHALRPDSPARDQGATGSLVDQRGVLRALGGAPDIGAFESVAPFGGSDAYEGMEGVLLTADGANGVLANDFGDSARAALPSGSGPQHGQLNLFEDGSFTYLPNPLFHGEDGFRYRLLDSGGRNSEEIAVTLTIRPRLIWLALSPNPGSEAQAWTPMVLSFDEPVTAAELHAHVEVHGSISGRRSFSVAMSGDGLEGTLTPVGRFSRGETVHVTVRDTMTSSAGSPFFPTETRTFEIFPNRAPVPAAARTFAIERGSVLELPGTESLLQGASDPDEDDFTVRTDVWVQGRLYDLLTRFPGVRFEDVQYFGNWPDGSWAVRVPVPAEHGQLNLRADGTFTYTPPPVFRGTDTFHYVLTDGELESAPVTITIQVGGGTTPPEPAPDHYPNVPFNLNQGVDAHFTLTVDAGGGVLANDRNVDELDLVAELVDDVQNGYLNLHPDGGLTYQSFGSLGAGIDAFTYRVRADEIGYVSGPVRVALGARALIVAEDFHAYSGAGILEVPGDAGVLANDFDPNLNVPAAETAWAELVTSPVHGTVVLEDDGSFTYTPGPDHPGSDVFVYRAGTSYSSGNDPQARVKLGNRAPVAVDDTYFLFQGQPRTVSAAEGLLANDRDPEGDPGLVVELLTPPSHGTLSLVTDGSFEYVPEPGFDAVDTFTYRVSDGRDGSQPATVTLHVVELLEIVSVNPPANTTDAPASGPVRITFSGAVEPSSVEGRVQAFGALTGRREITVTVDGPEVALHLAEPFLPGEAVTVHVSPGIREGVRAELARPHGWQFHAEVPRGSAVFERTLAGTPTAEFSEFVTLADLNGNRVPDAIVWNRDAHPRVYLNHGDATFTEREESLGLQYPNLAFRGSAPLVADLNGDGHSDLALIGQVDNFLGSRSTEMRIGFNDGTGAFPEAGVAVFGLSNFPLGAPVFLLAGDFDGDGDLDLLGVGSSWAWVWRNDGHGNFTFDPGSAVAIASASAGAVGDLNHDGLMDVYLVGLPGGQLLINEGGARFALRSSGVSSTWSRQVVLADLDGNGTLDAWLVHQVNSGPNEVWLNDGAANFQLSPFGIERRFTLGVALGDLNADGHLDAWQADVRDGAGQGGGDGVLLNNGAARFTQFGARLGTSESLHAAVADLDGDGDLDVFVVNNSRTSGSGNEVWLNRSAPVARDDFHPANGSAPVVVAAAQGVLVNDLAGDGGPMQAQLVSAPALGSVVLASNGGFTYTPGTGFAGTDVFTYRAADAQASSAPARVKIGNTPPLAAGDGPYLVPAGDAFVVVASQGVLANDTDAEGDPLTAVLVTPPAHGTVVLRRDGSFVYTPAPGHLGADAFTYAATDGLENSTPATVTLEVRSILRVVEMSPSPNHPSAPGDRPMVLRFNRPLDPATVGANVTVAGGQSGPRRLRTGLNGTILTLTLDPETGFIPGEPVTVSVRSGLGGARGEILPGPFLAQFMVEAPTGTGTFTDSLLRIGNAEYNSVGIAIGDLNGNGHPDLFVPNAMGYFGQAEPHGARVWFNDGAGGFSEGLQKIGSKVLSKAQLADLNGNGHLDAITTHRSEPYGLTIFFNNGSGGFTEATQALESVLVEAFAVGDLNGDGAVDLVTLASAGFSNWWVRVWLNDGTGRFAEFPAAMQDISFANRTFLEVRLADLDGDGSLDLVLGQFSGPTLVWFNDGSGRFRDSLEPLGTGGAFPLVGDLNGDGAVDILTVRRSGAGPLVWLNDGAGQFTATGATFTGNTVQGAVLGDFDGSGALDLVVLQSEFVSAESQSFNRSVLLVNDGTGNFAPSGAMPGPEHPMASIGAGDLNGDGAMDLVLGGGFGRPSHVWFNGVGLPAPTGIGSLTITDRETARPFEGVSLRLPPTAPVTVRVEMEDAARGALLAAGFNGSEVAGYDLTGPAGTVEAALRAVLFVPARHRRPVGESETTGFTLTIGMGSLIRVDDGTVVTVLAENDPPLAADDGGAGYSTVASTAFTTPSVLLNDTDPNPGDTFAIVHVVTLGTIGQVTHQGGGVFHYDPSGRFPLPPGESVTDSFLYVVEDSHGARASARVTIRVHGENHPPSAPDLVVAVSEVSGDNVIDKAILAQATDPDLGDQVQIAAIDPSGVLGTVSLAADGTVRYNPSGSGPKLGPGGERLDGFGYTVSDRQGATASGRVTIRIEGRNDAPVAGLVAIAVAENDDPVEIAALLLATAADPDPGQTAQLRVVRVDRSLTQGQTGASGNEVFYSTARRFEGLQEGETATDRFDYFVEDPFGLTGLGTVTVTVTGVNSSPVAGEAHAVINLEPVTVDLTANLLANAADPDDDRSTLRVAAIDTDGTLGEVVLSGDTVRYTPPAGLVVPRDEFVTDRFRFRVRDPRGAESGVAVATVHLRGVQSPPTIEVDRMEQEIQYSDAIVPVTVVASDADTPGSDLLVRIGWRREGSAGAFEPGVPEGLSWDLALTEANAMRWTLSGRAQVAPGDYRFRVEVEDATASTDEAEFGIMVLPEDARSSFGGTLFQGTSSPTSGTTVLALRATVRDLSTLPVGDPEHDPYPARIRNATVSFVDRHTGSVIAANLPVQVPDPNTPSVGEVRFDWPVDIGTADSKSYSIGVILGGWFERDSREDDVLVTVSRPSASDMVTGGGYLVLAASHGIVPGTPGSKLDFGFNAKFIQGGKTLQGSVDFTLRSGGRVYQIRSSAVTSLAVQGNRSVFTADGVISDITGPGKGLAVENQATLQVLLTDRGEPGRDDSLAVAVWDRNDALWFSSRWNGHRTVEQTIGGGNLKIHSKGSSAAGLAGGSAGGPHGPSIEAAGDSQAGPEAGDGRGAGTFRLGFPAVPDRDYLVEASSDLTTWTPVARVWSLGHRIEVFEASHAPVRFYRARALGAGKSEPGTRPFADLMEPME